MKTSTIITTNLHQLFNIKSIGFICAIIAYFAVVHYIPEDAGLSLAGQRILGILVFAVIVWMTEAIDYNVSAILITGMIIFLIGMSPDVSKPDLAVYGTTSTIKMALDGFATPALALVASALVLAAAMSKTGLDRRIALYILSLVGTKTKNILIGSLLVGILLAVLVPSTTARVACLVPIILGIVSSFELSKNSRFSAMLMIGAPQIASIWNIGVQTAGAQNLVALDFFLKQFDKSISWVEWLIYAAPYSLFMTVVLYFILYRMMKPELESIPGGEDTIKKDLVALGPMSLDEKKLMSLSMILLFFWSTQKIVHPFDTAAVTLVGVILMHLPVVGILTWKETQNRIPWGTLILFGVGISLGNLMLSLNAASWLAKVIATSFHLEQFSSFAIMAIMGFFLIVVHLGFASATALTASMLPILIAIFKGLPNLSNPMGMALIMQFYISFGMILPVNGPQNMIAYGTDTFTTKDFIRIGLVLTIASYLATLLFGATYWKWMGLV